MANSQFPGFMPSSAAIGGGHISYRRHKVLSNNTNEIACQDSVKGSSSGDILGLGTSSTYTAGVDGVSMGASYLDANSQRIGRPNLPASTTFSGTTVDPVAANYVFVTEAADHYKYRCSVTLTTGTALTNIYNNFDINLASSLQGYSQQALRGASAATTNTLPWRMVDFIFAADNTLDSVNHTHILAMVNVGFTQPSLTNSTGT